MVVYWKVYWPGIVCIGWWHWSSLQSTLNIEHPDWAAASVVAVLWLRREWRSQLMPSTCYPRGAGETAGKPWEMQTSRQPMSVQQSRAVSNQMRKSRWRLISRDRGLGIWVNRRHEGSDWYSFKTNIVSLELQRPTCMFMSQYCLKFLYI